VMARALLRWYTTQGGPPDRTGWPQGWLITDSRLHNRRAPGNTCMSALGGLSLEEELPAVTSPPNESKGCGAAMRSAPCGLAGNSRDQAFDLARDSGVLTHGHASGYLSGAYFASVIWDLARGRSLDDAMSSADEHLARERGSAELVSILEKTRKLAAKGPPDRKTIEALGGGWTGEEALAIALLCALTFDERSPRAVENTLWRAAVHSGDSDSTAAITGNLLGAMVRVDGLPKRWLAALELRDVIERIAADLHRSMILGEDLDHDAYPPN
jgi:ADP-ribosyl-[dinitrogen reductase] hydrolase